jgi:acyl carrier protein
VIDMPSRDQVQSLLMDCVREYAEQAGLDGVIQENTPLIGPGAAVDSLGLVMVVTGFEARLNETFDTQIVLASEAAMSMNRSPFRSVSALADYAMELLTKKDAS